MTIKKRFKDRWPALVLPLSLFLLDSAVTLIGQPPYELRIVGDVNEANPFFHWAMRNGWFTHILIFVVWAVVITISVTIPPKFLGIGFAFAWTVGHSFGALSWLQYDSHFRLGHWILYPFSLAVGLACALCAKQLFKPDELNSRIPKP